MVATDTMVGIIGAVALVAVMVGVFVYEYNNEQPAPEDGALTDTENRTLFEEAFAGLNATDDLDEDGTPNYQDADIDGDGMDNAEDNVTMFEKGLSGSVDAQQSNPSTATLEVSQGAAELEVTINPTGTAVLPFAVCLIVENGEGEAFPQQCGMAGPLTVTSTDLIPGTYTITVQQQNQAGTPVTYTGTAMVHYGGTAAEHGH